MCDYHVWRDGTYHIQKRAQLAQRLGAGLWKHSHGSVRQQGRHQGQKGQGQIHRVSQEKEPAGML